MEILKKKFKITFIIMFKKKYLLLTLFLIIIFQIFLYTNNNQKTSFRYLKWTLQEVSIG